MRTPQVLHVCPRVQRWIACSRTLDQAIGCPASLYCYVESSVGQSDAAAASEQGYLIARSYTEYHHDSVVTARPCV